MVDVNGIVYWETGRTSMDTMPLTDPAGGVEKFDGVADADDIDSLSCLGNLLTAHSNIGAELDPGNYECRRSDRTGEHCERTIAVDGSGNLAVMDGEIAEDWQPHCLLRRKLGDTALPGDVM